MSKPTSLKEGDVVQFGLDRFVVRLRWIQLVVISSMLNKEQAKVGSSYPYFYLYFYLKLFVHDQI